ncbi:MAG: hypothetical protein R3C14_18605 [Caldilineaceae bacterium]
MNKITLFKKLRKIFLLSLLLYSLLKLPCNEIQAQQNYDKNQKQAIVRIRSQKCDAIGCRDLNTGSGVIIHPQGIILTAR